MSDMNKLSVAATLLLAVLPSATLAVPRELPVFKALCISEKEAGFNWKAGEWDYAKFKPGRQILIQKLNLAAYASTPAYETPVNCKAEPPKTFLTMTYAKGCYLIKEMGTKTFVALAETCTEVFDESTLKAIKCERLTFLPDGQFIERPMHDDINPKPKDDIKDSLALSVGKCSPLLD